MARKILISHVEPDLSRVAVLEAGKLREFYFEHAGQAKHSNNIYQGRVVNIEPSIDAAFLDVGEGRNGFLHESDVLDDYATLFDEDRYRAHAGGEGASAGEEPPPRGPRRKRKSIADLVTRGQEIVVQVTKDAIGTKGPTLSTNISIPGRYLVLMPSLQRWGVSRKIDDEAERRLKGLMEELAPPPGMGFIVRTAGIDKTKADLARDLRYLLRLWSVIVQRIRDSRGPCLIYRESDLVTRTLRDTYGTDVEEILVDTEEAARTCQDFLRMFAPRAQTSVRFHQGRKPLFYRFGVEGQIERMLDRKIDLPIGGSIVIDQTEALVAIDVNSGKYRQQEALEETAYRTNMEAVVEIARQIRLRDLGGVIINDLIDMRQDRHRREVERAFRAALKDDRARIKMVRISPLGIIEMTRQRVWPNMDRTFLQPCPRCLGTGSVKTEEYLMQGVVRRILWSLSQPSTTKVDVRAGVRLADRLTRARLDYLAELEQDTGKPIRILTDDTLGEAEAEVSGYSRDGRRTAGPRSAR